MEAIKYLTESLSSLFCNTIKLSTFEFGNVSGGNQPLRENYRSFNLGHKILIQGDAQVGMAPVDSGAGAAKPAGQKKNPRPRETHG